MGNYKQAGVSMSVFLLWCVIFGGGALLGFKLGPAYLENYTIQKHFSTLAKDPELATGYRRDIESAFSKRADIDRINAITAKDISVSKTEGGGISLSAAYTTRIPLVANISVCLDFNPVSK